jgi:hypothetical protein
MRVSSPVRLTAFPCQEIVLPKDDHPGVWVLALTAGSCAPAWLYPFAGRLG